MYSITYTRRVNDTTRIPYEGYVPDDMEAAWKLAAKLSDGRDVYVVQLLRDEIIDNNRALTYAWFYNGSYMDAATRYTAIDNA